MNNYVLLPGVPGGMPNFLIRYLPLRLHIRKNASTIKRGPPGLLPDSIGIVPICVLLMVSSLPATLVHPDRLVPTLPGFGLLSITCWFTRSIVCSTLLSALGYGVTWKLLMTAAVT